MAEDLAARFGSEEFCVVQPETPPDDAEFALNPIVNNTEFAVPNAGQPIVVHLSVGGVSIEPGDTPAILIGRARKASRRHRRFTSIRSRPMLGLLHPTTEFTR
jgi:PleD family two-component response regulator